jgi:hypothetical protein
MKLSIQFETDRPLTEEEAGALVLQLMAQIEEPVTLEGEDVEYTTSAITIEREGE